MTAIDSTEEVVGTFLSHLGAKDADALGDLFADNIDWQVPGHPELPWTGARTKRSEVPDYFRTMWPRFVEGESEVSLDRVIVSGADAVILANFTHTVADNGRRFSTPVAMHLQVQDGVIVVMHLFEDTHGVAEAFLA